MPARKKKKAKKNKRDFAGELLKTVRLLYKFYLTTPHWKAVRMRRLRAAHFQCEECGEHKTILDVHHLHYRSLGREKNKDLKVLCRPCHKDAHAKS